MPSLPATLDALRYCKYLNCVHERRHSSPAWKAKRPLGPSARPKGCSTPSPAKLEWLYAQSCAKAGRCRLTSPGDVFAACTRTCSAEKDLPAGPGSRKTLEEYTSRPCISKTWLLPPLCMEDCEPAWGRHFYVREYRHGYLRAPHRAVLRCSSASAEACELADSLFAELYGLTRRRPPQTRSLFPLFPRSRSSLQTWRPRRSRSTPY